MGYGMTNSQSPQVPYAASGAMKEKIPSGYKKASIQKFSDQGINQLNSLWPHVGPESYTARLAGGDQDLFNEMEAPAFRQFQELQGQTASRFSGMGLGGRRGSAFQNAINQQTSDFAQDLQSKRQNYMRQALKDLFEMSHGLMNEEPFEQKLVEKNKPWWQEALAGFAEKAGEGTSKYLTGKYL